jgi:hypothetical protein
MAEVIDFPTRPGAIARPAQPGAPADVVLLPSRVTRRAFLRREGLRLAAGGGLVSVPEITRRLRAWHAEAGFMGPAVDADIADALAFALAIRDAALRAVDGPRNGPDGSGRVA